MKNQLFLLISAYSFLLAIFPGSLVDSAIVKTSFGEVDGAETNGFHLFKRIPFAKPPLGKLRFQKPEWPEKWKGVWNSKEYGPACLSNSSITTSPQKWVDEDCLHINIFTSDKCLTSKNCAVVYYIHGGAINYDSAVMFNDTFLLGTFVNRDVVLVIPAFRLGIFSHFVVQDQNIAPNNLALYGILKVVFRAYCHLPDILQGLEFVKREISNFGGDNKRVTLLGHSYGGSITSMLTFSTKINQDKSLFQQAISMSSAHDSEPLEFQIVKARNFSRRAGCLLPSKLATKLSQNQQDLYTMKCLQKMNAMDLLRIQNTMEDEGYPKLESVVLREPLLQEVPYHEFMNSPNKIPMLTGCTRYEMDHAPENKPIAAAVGFENLKEVDEKYRRDWREERYDFGNHSDETQAIMVQTKMRVEKLLTNGIPTFLYEYTYPKHAQHTDDLFYIMGVHRFEKDENEEQLGKVYEEMFTNFAKDGHPGMGFEMANLENASYFDVYWDVETGRRPQMRNGFEKGIINYWTVDMVAYDKNITALKKAGLFPQNRLQSKRFYSETFPKYQYPYIYFTMLILTLIFFTGCIVGRCCCRDQTERNLYIRLDGTDNAYHAVKDF